MAYVAPTSELPVPQITDSQGLTHELTARYILSQSNTLKTYEDILQAIGDHGGYVILPELPTANADAYALYYDKIVLIAKTSPLTGYVEYLIVRTGTSPNYSYEWTEVGDTDIDLSNYVQMGTYTTASDGTHTHTVDVKTYSATKAKFIVNKTTDAALSTSKDGFVQGYSSPTQSDFVTALGTPSTDKVLGKDTTFETSVTPTTSKLVTTSIKGVAGTKDVAKVTSAGSVVSGTAPSFAVNVDTNGVVSFSFTAGTTPSTVTLPTFGTETVATANSDTTTVATGGLDANGSGASVATGITSASTSAKISGSGSDVVDVVTGLGTPSTNKALTALGTPTTAQALTAASVGTQAAYEIKEDATNGTMLAKDIAEGTAASVTSSSSGVHTHDITFSGE